VNNLAVESLKQRNVYTGRNSRCFPFYAGREIIVDIIMKQNAVIIEADRKQHELLVSRRDWHLLNGPFFNEGPLFLNTLGVYKNFTVAKGIPKGSTAKVNRFVLCQVAEQLLAAIQRDIDLLQYNYSFRFTACTDKDRSPNSGFMVNGYDACLSTRPNGFCLLRLMESSHNARSRLVGQLDIRNKSRSNRVEYSRLRKAKSKSPDGLPPMMNF
jgi:hypothetical protein